MNLLQPEYLSCVYYFMISWFHQKIDVDILSCCFKSIIQERNNVPVLAYLIFLHFILYYLDKHYLFRGVWSILICPRATVCNMSIEIPKITIKLCLIIRWKVEIFLVTYMYLNTVKCIKSIGKLNPLLFPKQNTINKFHFFSSLTTK